LIIHPPREDRRKSRMLGFNRRLNHPRLPSLPSEVLHEECIRDVRKTLYECLAQPNPRLQS